MIRGLINVPATLKGCVLTIGAFDGVHLGHQALLERVKKEAKKRHQPSVVVTFEPQPAEYFASAEQVAPRLTRRREKFQALSDYGIDYVLVLSFNARLAALSAEDFIQQIVCDSLQASHVVVGDDFRFGYKRLGDYAYLKERGAVLGFTVESMPSFLLEEERVSSTRVRAALLAGDHRLADRLLGRPYSLKGRVVRGDQRGRQMGYATANIYLAKRMTAVQGVYVVRLHGIADVGLPGVANLGVRPTVDGTRCLLEVHVFDFDQDIYGRQVCVEFCEKLRDEKRFDSLEALKAEIHADAAKALAWHALHTDKK